MRSRPRIAVFAGPTATILNSPDLITSNKARGKYGLPARKDQPFDVLRPQRLAAPVTVYIEAYSAHPLESDAADLSAPPDGWLDEEGVFHGSRPTGHVTPVYVVELHPKDGLYPLPYMGRQADGSPWEGATTRPFAPAKDSRQTFYPDASRVYEEIERLGIGDHGEPVGLAAMADFDFFRAAPSAGYTRGPEPETPGQDFFVYYPYHLQTEPHVAHLASLTNLVQRTLNQGSYDGVQWLEGSPTVDETVYWLGLLIDTTVPIVGHAAHRRHQALSADGARNIVDGVKFLASHEVRQQTGPYAVGPCIVVDELVYSARDVAKTDGRPGGYETTGGHGGVVADMGGYGPPRLTYLPTRLHTYQSQVRTTVLPTQVNGVKGSLNGAFATIPVVVKDASGALCAEAMPHVSITKYSRYAHQPAREITADTDGGEVEVLARIRANLADAPLAGFVCEGMSPYGMADPARNEALRVAVFAGMPVVRTGRGNTGGMAYRTDPTYISGDNLTATKARLLLMAALLKLGCLPPARDPFNPTDQERDATVAAVLRYQQIFDAH